MVLLGENIMDNIILKVENIRKSYGRHKVLKGQALPAGQASVLELQESTAQVNPLYCLL